MMKWNRIVIPTDFSELAMHALHYACDLSRAYHAELHVLHVVSLAQNVPVAPDGGAALGGLGGVGGVVMMESIQEVVERKLTELRAIVAELGPDLPARPITIVRNGVPWKEVASYADEIAADLIVIGSHARGVMSRILLGSTSKAVLEHSMRPVLMVPISSLERESKSAPHAASPGGTA
ncbi:MAG: universal stress protein [Planctomycetes bacterium]|nr:universal stress protein [Planctomycetota bacterium]